MNLWKWQSDGCIFRRLDLSLHPEEHSQTTLQNPICNVSSLQTHPQVKVVQSKVETSTEFLWSLPIEAFTPGGGVSCAKRGGQNGRSCVRSLGTGTAWLPCACGSVLSARLNGQTSMCSLPTCTCRASHLHIQRKTGISSGRHFQKTISKKAKLVCEWRITGVCPAVRLEMGAFCVHLGAAGEVAVVNSPLP